MKPKKYSKYYKYLLAQALDEYLDSLKNTSKNFFFFDVVVKFHTCVELYIRERLEKMSPYLLYSLGRDEKDVVQLVSLLDGFNEKLLVRGNKTVLDYKTVGFTELITRAARLFPDVAKSVEDIKYFSEVRNKIIHSGDLDYEDVYKAQSIIPNTIIPLFHQTPVVNQKRKNRIAVEAIRAKEIRIRELKKYLAGAALQKRKEKYAALKDQMYNVDYVCPACQEKSFNFSFIYNSEEVNKSHFVGWCNTCVAELSKSDIDFIIQNQKEFFGTSIEGEWVDPHIFLG